MKCALLFIFINYEYHVDGVGVKHILTDYRKMNSRKIKDIAFPDTNWCGPGTTAQGFDDLGAERQTDLCCRAHDYCPDYISAYGTNDTLKLTNHAGYTRLSCTCDDAFYDCLSELRSLTAQTVRHIYFNIIDTKCFVKDYPLQCQKSKGLLIKVCSRYEINRNADMTYQWVDVRNRYNNSTEQNKYDEFNML